MNGVFVVTLNLTRITQDSYFKVPSSMIELFVEVLNKMLHFLQKFCYYGITKIIMQGN